MTNVKDGLNGLLADATVLYQKLRTFHWDVAGPHFFELHEKFEEQYQRFAQIVDDIAERILTIEGKPLGTLAALLEAAEIKEATKVPNARDMVASLEADYGTILRRSGELLGQAESAGDRGTVNLLDEIRDDLEKTRWMLRAYLKG